MLPLQLRPTFCWNCKSNVSHIDKIEGFEYIYKTYELLHLLSIGFGIKAHLSLYASLSVYSAINTYKISHGIRADC